MSFFFFNPKQKWKKKRNCTNINAGKIISQKENSKKEFLQEHM